MKKQKSGYWCQICQHWHRNYSKIGKAHSFAIDHRKSEQIREGR